MNNKIFRFRLIVNSVGCIVIIIVSLFICLSMFPLLPATGDPDRDKGILVQMAGFVSFGILGAIAVVSLLRTIRKWRRLPKE